MKIILAILITLASYIVLREYGIGAGVIVYWACILTAKKLMD